jgi:ATP-dependent helicase Lhr and Lhr-like helicase
VDPRSRYDNLRLRLRADLAVAALRAAADEAKHADALPEVTDEATRGLKFADVLPAELARRAVAARLADSASTRRVLAEPVRFDTA